MNFHPLPFEDSTYAAPVDTIFVLLTTLSSVITTITVAAMPSRCAPESRSTEAESAGAGWPSPP